MAVLGDFHFRCGHVFFPFHAYDLGRFLLSNWNFFQPAGRWGWLEKFQRRRASPAKWKFRGFIRQEIFDQGHPSGKNFHFGKAGLQKGSSNQGTPGYVRGLKFCIVLKKKSQRFRVLGGRGPKIAADALGLLSLIDGMAERRSSFVF